MRKGTKGSAEAGLRTLFEFGTLVGNSDCELLDLFTTAEPAAEQAFAALVERHGPMVWHVCRDVLRESNDADDAFQATFLILARRSRSIRSRSSLGPWLYGVALRVARSARSRTARRRNREQVAVGPRLEVSMTHADKIDEAPILHEEVSRLPEKYRAPVVLCYFEGLTHDQAASRLGWPVGTVRSRLANARERLRQRLLRRGVAPSVAILVASGQLEAATALPEALISSTVGMAVQAGTAGMVPASVSCLVDAILRKMMILKTSIIMTALFSMTLAGFAGVSYFADAKTAVTPNQSDQAREANANFLKVSLHTVRTKGVTLLEQYVCQIQSIRHIGIRSPDKGFISLVSIKDGQTVKRDDVLFESVSLKTENAGKVLAIKAPFDGIVGRAVVQEGSLVEEGDILTELFDNSVMWVYFNVPEKRYFEYMADQRQNEVSLPVQLILANQSMFPQAGKIGAIDAKFNNQTGTITFRADFLNPEGILRHGQIGNVLIKRELKNAITVPQRATLEILDKRYIYVVDKANVAHMREITIQGEVDDVFVVATGVNVGEKILNDGLRKVHDGEKVNY